MENKKQKTSFLEGLFKSMIYKEENNKDTYNDYEPYNFEEEELEDDDYYNEDLD